MNDDISPDIVICDATGNFKLRQAMRIVFYFNQPHQSIVPGIRDVITGFVDMVPAEAFGYYYGLDGEAEEFSKEAFSTLMYSWFAGSYSNWPNATIRLVGHDYTVPEYGLRYFGKGLDDPAFPDDTCLLYLWMPRRFFLENLEAIDNYFRFSLMQVPVSSGYLSFALIGDDRRAKQALAKRYFGLDIADPESVSIDLGIKCPGSYWTTYLGPELASKLGGRSTLLNLFEKGSSVEELTTGGFLLRLTPTPELGDHNRQEKLLNNEIFARLLEVKNCLHVPQQVVYFEDERGLADFSAQKEWHQRFV